MSTNVIAVFFYGLFMDESLLASKGVHPTNSTTYGMLMNITSREAATLYSEQSVADYVAEPVVVKLPGELQVSAVCYNLPAAKLTGTNPEYADALLTLATELALPDSYLSHIRNAVAAS